MKVCCPLKCPAYEGMCVKNVPCRFTKLSLEEAVKKSIFSGFGFFFYFVVLEIRDLPVPNKTLKHIQ